MAMVLSEEDSCEFFKTIPHDLQFSQAPSPTGICISNKKKHIGLELSKLETGLPTHSVGDEYELSLGNHHTIEKGKT